MSFDNNNNIRNKTPRCQSTSIRGTITALNMNAIKEIQFKFFKVLAVLILLQGSK